MTTEDAEPVAPVSTGNAASSPGGTSQPEQSKSTEAGTGAVAQPSAGTGEKTLSNAELKKKAKEEKALRRQQAKAAQTAAAPPAAAPPGAAAAAAAAAAAKGKSGKQDAAGVGSGGASGKQNSKFNQAGAPAAGGTAAAQSPPSPGATVPECFSHLPMAKRLTITQADKDVHPAVLQLGQQMSTFTISDSITRTEATLLAFKKVIESYTTPHGATLSRHLTSVVLKQQIEYLAACRPMCFSMGNAIRWLKLQISKTDIDLPDAEARLQLAQAIDTYLFERVTLADDIIVRTAADMVAREGDIIVTYAHHHLVERVLLRAHREENKKFRVILIDDPSERIALEHARRLVAAGISVSYTHDFGAIRGPGFDGATYLLVAAEALFGGGDVYARGGTADIVTVAADRNVRVVVLCERINFTERVPTDSLTYNEIDPDRCTADEFRLLFDVTKEKFITTVVTELGISSAKSTATLLRRLEGP